MSPLQFIASSEWRIWLFPVVAIQFGDEARWFALALFLLGAWFAIRYARLWHVAHRQVHGDSPGWVSVAMGPMPAFFAIHFFLMVAWLGLLWALHPLIPTA